MKGFQVQGLAGHSMQQYRAYFIGPDDLILDRVDLVCVDENDARKQAKKLADAYAVELWHSDRMIERFEPPVRGPPRGARRLHQEEAALC